MWYNMQVTISEFFNSLDFMHLCFFFSIKDVSQL